MKSLSEKSKGIKESEEDKEIKKNKEDKEKKRIKEISRNNNKSNRSDGLLNDYNISIGTSYSGQMYQLLSILIFVTL